MDETRSGTTGSTPFLKLVLAGLTVVAITALWCWWTPWCWWRTPCPDVVVDCGDCEPESILVVEEGRAAVWMALDNRAFMFGEDRSSSTDVGPSPDASSDGGEEPEPRSVCSTSGAPAFGDTCGGNYVVGEEYHHGLLFQTGDVVTFDDGERSTTTYYAGVEITYEDGTVELLPGEDDDFDWLDVNPTGAECVIDPLHAYAMVNPLVEGADPVVGTECDDLGVDSEPDFSCMRNRSLHHSVIANRILTVWAGDDDYSMSPKIYESESDDRSVDPEHGPRGTGYEFGFPETVTVDRWKEGCWQERYTRVTEIRILFDGSPAYHYGFYHPPMDGGNYSYPP